jgi:hypothetical protein
MLQKNYLLSIVAVLVLAGFSSCKKDGPGRHHDNSTANTPTVLNVSVQSGNAYKLNLSAYGDGSPSITKQATSYTTSEIAYDNASRSYVYTYNSTSPKAGETITDKVMLKIINSSSQQITSGGCNGGNGNHDTQEKNITINFTVN